MSSPEAPPSSGPRVGPLTAFFAAWNALCAAAGRRSLAAVDALAAGTEEQREALAAALMALGYPEAMSSPKSLGSTLRSLRGRKDAGGHLLDRSQAGGRSIWYVIHRPAAAA